MNSKKILVVASALSVFLISNSWAAGNSTASLKNFSFTLTDLNLTDNYLPATPDLNNTTGTWSGLVTSGPWEVYHTGITDTHTPQNHSFARDGLTYSISTTGPFEADLESTRNSSGFAYSYAAYSLPALAMPHTSIAFSTSVILHSEVTESRPAVTAVWSTLDLNGLPERHGESAVIYSLGTLEQGLVASWANNTDAPITLTLVARLYAGTPGIASSVPEPATYGMLAAGALVLLQFRRRDMR